MPAPGSVENGQVGVTTTGVAVSEMDYTYGGAEVGSFTVGQSVINATVVGSIVPDDSYALVGTVLDDAGDADPLFYSQESGLYFAPGLDATPTNGAVVSAVTGPGPNDLITNYIDGSSAEYNYGTETETLTPCFCRGTLIATPDGQTAVEELLIGDMVTTTTGEQRPIKWIGRRSYTARFALARRDLSPVCIKAGAFGNSRPSRNLYMSPLHAVFAEGSLIPISLLVNGVSITQTSENSDIDYIHIELDSHDTILAEGLPVETFLDEGNRLIFQNGHEFKASPTVAEQKPHRSCAPRLESGHQVERLKSSLRTIAGLEEVAIGAGPMRGSVDSMESSQISGWAQNIDFPEAPVCLDITVDGVVVVQVLACQFRQDLNRAGLGSGRHGFVVDLPKGTVKKPGARVAVCRSIDGHVLAERVVSKVA